MKAEIKITKSEENTDTFDVEFCGITFRCQYYWQAKELKINLERVAFVNFEPAP